MPKVKTRQANIYYELHGSGHPLILIAGFGCDHSIWIPLLNMLTPQFQVLLIDNRGSGQTENYHPDPLSMQLLSEDIMSVANSLNLVKPHIIGHSMGGSIAQQLAINHPDIIAKLILFNTSAKTNAIAITVLQGLIGLQKNQVPLPLILDAFIPWGFSETFLSNANNITLHKKMVLEYPYPQTLEGNQSQLQALSSYDGRHQLKNILSPTLLVGMERDLLVSLEEIQYLNQHITNSRSLILPGSHLSIFEDPELGARIILDFLK